MDFKIAQYVTFAKYFNLDYTYEDGGHGENINYRPVKNFVHNYHCRLFLSTLKKALEGIGKDGLPERLV